MTTSRRCLVLARFIVVAAATAGISAAHAGGTRTVVGSGDDAPPLVVVEGTPFEMGRQLGELMRPEAVGFLVPRAHQCSGV